jgi:hypothetical protein
MLAVRNLILIRHYPAVSHSSPSGLAYSRPDLEIPEIATSGLILALLAPGYEFGIVPTADFLAVAVVAEAPLSAGALLAAHAVAADGDALRVIVAVAHCVGSFG